ncbi:hypothetical protein CW304_29485 [Bacillus sp. UFRGS-B20]|nr:hypothetical protein CW304_29485 [Bacillus sp. UFRGS-B20]
MGNSQSFSRLVLSSFSKPPHSCNFLALISYALYVRWREEREFISSTCIILFSFILREVGQYIGCRRALLDQYSNYKDLYPRRICFFRRLFEPSTLEDGRECFACYLAQYKERNSLPSFWSLIRS